MSFQFSPETIVIQFEDLIKEQQSVVKANEPTAVLIKPLQDEKATLTPGRTVRFACQCRTVFY